MQAGACTGRGWLIPDAVLHRYTELLAQHPVSIVDLTAVISLDAELLARWCRLLDCGPDVAAIVAAIERLDSTTLTNLGLAIGIALVAPGADLDRSGVADEPQRFSLDEWGGRLANAVLAEVLAARSTALDPPTARLQSLLGLAQLRIPADGLMAEMYEFRAATAVQLQDAHPLLRVFSIVESYHSGDESAAVESAQVLLGLSPDAFSESLQCAAQRTDALMTEAGLAQERYGDWLASMWSQLQVVAFSSVLSRAQNMDELMSAHQLVSRSLFGFEPLVLAAQPGSGALILCNQAELSLLTIDLDSETSTIAASARDLVEAEISDRTGAPIAERQLLRRLGVHSAMVEPLVRAGVLHGVCVFALGDEPGPGGPLKRRAYARVLGEAMSQHADATTADVDLVDVAERRLNDYSAVLEQRMREIVHEANNPLSIVRNYLHILELRLQDNPSALAQLDLISKEVQRAADVIRQVVDVPADTELRAPIDAREFDLNVIVQGVCELASGTAHQYGVVIGQRLHNEPLVVHSDRDRLTQVLTNLIKNAIEALGEHEGVDGRVEVVTATGIYRAGREGVEVRVQDNGRGLPSEVLGKLFEPKLSNKGGAHEGLGLHIVKRLVDDMLGEIDVRTSPDSGTEFALFLPLNQPP